MVSNIATIVGATGTQAGGIIDFLVDNPEYKLRGLTRNPESASAQELKTREGDVVKADPNDLTSPRAAFPGFYAVYGLKDMPGTRAELGDNDAAITAEERQGINIAKAWLEIPGL